MPHPPTRPIDAIVLLDKPAGLSSNQALQRVRHLLGAAKGGHTGSLDPLATGLLPLCFGEATKIAGLLLGSRKAYRARCRLGETTDTGDAEGEMTRRRAVPEFTREQIEAALAPLRGRIRQIPPVYSAIKREGEPLYRRARRGEDVHPPARDVEVHRLELEAFDALSLDLHVECGSGTYVRSLVSDIGEALGCGAHLSALRRLWVAPFMQPRMHTLDELRSLAGMGADALAGCLLPVDAGLSGLPRLNLDAEQSRRVSHGQTLADIDSVPGRYAVYAADGRLLALSEVGEDGRMRCTRGFNLAPQDPATGAAQE